MTAIAQHNEQPMELEVVLKMCETTVDTCPSLFFSPADVHLACVLSNEGRKEERKTSADVCGMCAEQKPLPG